MAANKQKLIEIKFHPITVISPEISPLFKLFRRHTKLMLKKHILYYANSDIYTNQVFLI